MRPQFETAKIRCARVLYSAVLSVMARPALSWVLFIMVGVIGKRRHDVALNWGIMLQGEYSLDHGCRYRPSGQYAALAALVR